jgi:hypothetical protein
VGCSLTNLNGPRERGNSLGPSGFPEADGMSAHPSAEEPAN